MLSLDSSTPASFTTFLLGTVDLKIEGTREICYTFRDIFFSIVSPKNTAQYWTLRWNVSTSRYATSFPNSASYIMVVVDVFDSSMGPLNQFFVRGASYLCGLDLVVSPQLMRGSYTPDNVRLSQFARIEFRRTRLIQCR